MLLVGLVLSSADALGGTHDIAFTKTCASPTRVTELYACAYTIENVDAASDDLAFTSIADSVSQFAAVDVFANIVHEGKLVAQTGPGTATCGGAGISGAGTFPDPWVNATSCTLHPGARIRVLDFGFYTVQGGDYTLPGSVLTDQATLTWQDLCTSGGTCPVGNQFATSNSQTNVIKLASSTSTQIFSSGGLEYVIVSVIGPQGSPTPTSLDYVPTGSNPPFVLAGVNNVVIERFQDTSCATLNGATPPTRPLNANGQFDSSTIGFSQFPGGSFRATFLGDQDYAPSVGPCEPTPGVLPTNGIPLDASLTTSTGTVNGPSVPPAAFWTDPMTISFKGCTGGASATFAMDDASHTETISTSAGTLSEVPAASGNYTGTFSAASPSHGSASIAWTFTNTTCPGDGFNLYIDPSGVVRDAYGLPVVGATVTLYRSDAAGGPFAQVPAGSLLMSPGNRANSDLTVSGELFGWDVFAGFYKVLA